MTDASIVRLSDGRELEYRTAGPEDGEVLLFHHGTPGAGIPFGPMADAAASRGLRTVMYTRPGYGGSTRHRGRTVADAAADSLAVVDAVGATTFRTIGWSGGGPHALACGALLKERCLSTVTIAGVAPYPADGIDWFDGMGEENVAEFGAAVEGEVSITSFLQPYGEMFPNIQGGDVAESLGGLIPDVDKAELTGEFADWVASTFRDGMRSGVDGMVDDDLAFTSAWGFDITVVSPLTVWQGGLDKMVPFAHGVWLAEHIPGAQRRLFDDEGHLSVAVGSFDKVLDHLLSPTKEGTPG